MSVLLLSIACLVLLIVQEVSSQITLWPQDDKVWVDAELDLNISNATMASAILTPRMLNIESIKSTNDIYFFYNQTDNAMNITILPTLARGTDPVNNKIIYQFGPSSVRMDERNFTAARSLNIINSNNFDLSSRVTGGSKLQCLDAKQTGSNYVTIICKLIWPNSTARIEVYTYNLKVPTDVVYASSTTSYPCSTLTIPTVYWSGYARTSSCETEEIAIVSDYETSSNIRLFYLVGKNSSSGNITLSKHFTVYNKTSSALGDLKADSALGMITSTFGVSTAVPKSCKTFLIIAARHKNNGLPNWCTFESDNGVGAPEIIGNVIDGKHQVINESFNITFVCNELPTFKRHTHFMQKVARPSSDAEIFIKGSIEDLSNSTRTTNEFQLTYDVTVIKPIDITSQASKTVILVPFLRTTFSNFPVLNYTARINVVIPDKIFYVCWMINEPAIVFSQPCKIVDLFEFDKVKYLKAPADPPTNYMKLLRRDYGSFLSFNYDFDEATNSTMRMIGLREFKYLSGYTSVALTVWDMKKFNYAINLNKYCDNVAPNCSFEVPVTPSTNLTIPITTLPLTAGYILMPKSVNTHITFFAKDFSTMLDMLTDRVYMPATDFTVEPLPTLPGAKIYRYWNFQLPSKTFRANTNTFVVENRIIEFWTENGNNKMVIRNFDLCKTASTTSVEFEMCNTYIVGEFSSTLAQLSSSSLHSAEVSGKGLYIYFGPRNTITALSTSMSFGVIRYDMVSQKWSYRVSSIPSRVYESSSRLYVVTMATFTKPPSATVLFNVSIEMVPDTAGKNLNIAPNAALCINMSMESGYLLDNINNMHLQILTNRSLFLNFLTKKSTENTFHISRYELREPSQVLMANSTRIFKKILDEAFIPNSIKQAVCTFNDVIAFSCFESGKENRVIIYNVTKRSYYEYSSTGTSDSNKPVLYCDEDFVTAYFRQDSKLVLLRLDADLTAYKRIRTISTGNLNLQAQHSFGSKTVMHQLDDTKKFMLVSKKGHKTFFVSSIANSSNSPTVSQGVTTIKTTTNDTWNKIVLSAVQVTKPMVITGEHKYIGTEALETQKKLLYDSSSKKNYVIEDDFRLPITTFAARLQTSIDPKRIEYVKRVRQFDTVDLWLDNQDTREEKRCNFSLRGADIATIVDDIMMRVEIKDDIFCIEISRLKFDEKGAKKIVAGSNQYLFQSGVVQDCRLTRDSSMASYEDVAKRRANRQNIDYGIVCIVNKQNVQYLWMLGMPLGDTIDGIRTQGYLTQMPISLKFTRYHVIQVLNYFYAAFVDEESQVVNYLKKITIAGNQEPDNTTITVTATSLEFMYVATGASTDSKTSGLIMILNGYTINTTDPINATTKLPNNYITSYLSRIGANFQMDPIQKGLIEKEKFDVLQPVVLMTCAVQTLANDTSMTFPACAFLLSSSRNVIFYIINPMNASCTMNYIAPFNDFEIRQLLVVHHKEFLYIALTFSPLTGKSMLLVYTHTSNSFKKDLGLRNWTDYAQSEVLILDSVELSETGTNLDSCNLGFFVVDGERYISIHNGRTLTVYKISKIEIILDKDLQFSSISQSKLEFVDHQGVVYYSLILDNFFREKRSATWVWLIIFASTLVFAGILVGVYMLLKKNHTALQNEIAEGMAHSKKDRSSMDIELL